MLLLLLLLYSSIRTSVTVYSYCEHLTNFSCRTDLLRILRLLGCMVVAFSTTKHFCKNKTFTSA